LNVATANRFQVTSQKNHYISALVRGTTRFRAVLLNTKSKGAIF